MRNRMLAIYKKGVTAEIVAARQSHRMALGILLAKTIPIERAASVAMVKRHYLRAALRELGLKWISLPGRKVKNEAARILKLQTQAYRREMRSVRKYDELNHWRQLVNSWNVSRYSKRTKCYLRRYQEQKAAKTNYFIASRLRARISNAFKRRYKFSRKRHKNSAGSTMELLGCSIDFFRENIENQFQAGMSWDNYGMWHLDHRKPLSKFNLLNQTELQQAMHYTNYQPLWAADNWSKGNRYEN